MTGPELLQSRHTAAGARLIGRDHGLLLELGAVPAHPWPIGFLERLETARSAQLVLALALGAAALGAGRTATLGAMRSV